MKKLLFFLVIFTATVSLFAQQKKLNAFIAYSLFTANDTEKGASPYLETYISFDKKSLEYIKTNDKFQAEINVTILFRQGETVKNFGKYTVKSPVENDTLVLDGLFMDAQRYFLDNGNYIMDLTLTDPNNITDKPIHIEQDITVDMPDNTICFSNILALERFTPSASESILNHNGYELTPMIMPYYPVSLDKLTFYTEIYNTKKVLGEKEKYLLNTYIVAVENNTKLNNFSTTRRLEAKDTEVLINTFDISALPSGNYFLVLEARNRNNEIIGLNRLFFQRSNPNYHIDETALGKIVLEQVFSSHISNLDTLREYISCLEPISSEVERDYANNIIKEGKLDAMQRFFYSFWSSRSAIDPQGAWQKYYTQVLLVNRSFKTVNQPGYKSDRGYIYLKYGTPDKIVQNYNEPGAYPYEIWHYYVLPNGQRNKKFVFMTLDIATNDFNLIHSDAVGELNNFRWQTEIYMRTYGTYNDYGVDGSADSDKSYGDHAGDYYNNPR